MGCGSLRLFERREFFRDEGEALLQHLDASPRLLTAPEKSLGDYGSKFIVQGPPTLPQILVAGRFNLNVAIGGPGLARQAIELGLVDEFWMFRNPVVVGGGNPYLPAVAQRIELDLVETRTFANRVVYERYRRAPGPVAARPGAA